MIDGTKKTRCNTEFRNNCTDLTHKCYSHTYLSNNYYNSVECVYIKSGYGNFTDVSTLANINSLAYTMRN